MGIPQLQKLIEDKNILEKISVSEEEIVIDGQALFYHLYSHLFDVLGGDYPGFKEQVATFFERLESCRITPHVVLDGALRRKKKEARQKAQPEKNTEEPLKIIPQLTKDVFIQVLKSRDISFEICLGEADLTIAQRANEKECHVLSHDTDFCIYDLKKGLLLLKYFKWEQSNGAVPASCYNISAFRKLFKLRQHVMAVFAALAGNDYSRWEDKKYGIERLLYICETLKDTDLNKSESRDKALLEKALRSFNITDTEPFMTSIRSYEEEPDPPHLPQWITTAIQTGKLTSFVISAVIENNPEVKDSNPSTDIKLAFYKLLRREQPDGQLEVEHLNEESRRQRLFQVLDVKHPPENIPDQLKLPGCVTLFWLQHVPKDSPKSNVDALLLGFVYGLEETDDEWVRTLKDEGKRSAVNTQVAHAFSQWYTCMRQSFYLNQLLQFPLPDPECARLYCGPLVHRLAAKLEADDSEIKRLNQEQRKLFDQLKEWITAPLEVWESVGGKKKRGKKAQEKTSKTSKKKK
ncbi:protein asteroid homolog 1-like [Cololabis saira]|uniref:protein asteroid homolog 1-like n=1 Tax=Cololabis saira TaxID=129043 RepID=UPI002AD47918|nr:protein asteroid homolog 1-like [Cololabis saira]